VFDSLRKRYVLSDAHRPPGAEQRRNVYNDVGTRRLRPAPRCRPCQRHCVGDYSSPSMNRRCTGSSRSKPFGGDSASALAGRLLFRGAGMRARKRSASAGC
jgi:hypothetical protein